MRARSSCAIVDRAYAIDFSLPCFANCATVPGWAMSAMSGGLPPATAVASTVGRLSPTGLYLTWTFGYVLLKRLMTSWNCFWPEVDVQMPSKVIVPGDGEVAGRPGCASSSRRRPEPCGEQRARGD